MKHSAHARVPGFVTVSILAIISTTFGMVPAAIAGSPQGQEPARKQYKSGPVVEGKVILPDGAVAAGVDVYLLQRGSGQSITLPTHPRKVVTGADGSFQYTDNKPGTYVLWAENSDATSLSGFLVGEVVHVSEEALADAAPVSLQLHPGCGYDVSVHELASGKAVPGAKISFGWTDIEREFACGYDGVARIRQLASNKWYFVVRAEGLETQFLNVPKQEMGTVLPVRFDLKPGGSIAGTLRDDSGNPVPNVRIGAQTLDRSMKPSYGEFRTDSEGHFLLTGLPADQSLEISCREDGFLPITQTSTAHGNSIPTQMDLVIHRRPYGGDVIFHVRDENNNPIENATVSNMGNSSADVRAAKTGADGEIKLQDLFRGFRGFAITVTAPGYQQSELSLTETGTVESPIKKVVTMIKGRTLEGVLLKPDGSPAPGIQVYTRQGTNPSFRPTVTDREGKFKIDGLGETVWLSIYTPKEYAPIDMPRADVIEGKVMEFRMEPAAILLARAIDADTGEPIPEFNVKIGFCSDTQPGDVSSGGISGEWSNPGINIRGTVRELRLDHLRPKVAYQMKVSADGYESTTLSRVVVQDRNTAEMLDVPLKLDGPENYHRIAGQLLDEDENPMSGVAVQLIVGSGVPASWKSDLYEPVGAPKWEFYNWDILKRGDAARSEHCVQHLTMVSDREGKFEFPKVRKNQPWIELFFFGDNIVSQRHSNLVEYTDAKREDLFFKALRPASISVTVDRKVFPDAFEVRLSAYYSESGAEMAIPFGYESKPVRGNAPVTFDLLPPGMYSVSVAGPLVPIPNGNGGMTQDFFGSQKMEVSAGEDKSVRINKKD